MNWKTNIFAILISVLFAANAFAAYEDYNKRYGEYRFNKLPEKASVAKTIWVGQWWSYKADGMANRYRGGYGLTKYQPLPEGEDLDKLSPAEKLDMYLERMDKIDYDKIKAYIDEKDKVENDVDAWIAERRELVYKLNKMIGEDPSLNWKETEEGKKYIKLGEDIEEKQAALKDLDFDADTAYEWEIKEHGNFQFGVGSWWGHCNAWAAAAVIEPEPVRDAEINGVPFNVGDVKGLLTEAWMECNSSFFGTRCERHTEEDEREKISYQDVTPAAFHIFFADQIGNQDKSFVIDAFTGDEVWNHPVKSYWTQCEPQYEVEQDGTATAEKVNVKLTHYGGWAGGEPEIKELGEKDVYPVLCTTAIHYMSDGVAHDAITEPYDFDAMTWDKYKTYYSKHFSKRTLTYVLWLSHPEDSDEARIIGDGQWNHGATSGYTDLHPDFLWQPLGNTNNSGRVYENEFVDYDVLANEILPKTLAEADDPEVEPEGFVSTDTPVTIPDGLGSEQPGEPALSTINVAGDITIATMTVTVDIAHTYIADLRITVTGPNGKEVELKPFGEGGGDDDVKRTWDVKDFDGQDGAGAWILKVLDNWNADTGTINSWSMTIK